MAIPASARLGTREVASVLGVSRGYVARQCQRGRFPCLCVGGRWRFTSEDVEAIAAMFRREVRREVARVQWGELPLDANAPVVSVPRRQPFAVRSYARVR